MLSGYRKNGIPIQETVKLHAAGGHAWWACNACARRFAPVAATLHDVPVPEYLSVSKLTQRIPYSDGTIRHFVL